MSKKQFESQLTEITTKKATLTLHVAQLDKHITFIMGLNDEINTDEAKANTADGVKQIIKVNNAQIFMLEEMRDSIKQALSRINTVLSLAKTVSDMSSENSEHKPTPEQAVEAIIDAIVEPTTESKPKVGINIVSTGDSEPPAEVMDFVKELVAKEGINMDDASVHVVRIQKDDKKDD